MVIHAMRPGRGRTRFLFILLIMGIVACSAGADQRIDENVVYGMYSGLALTLDVHYPAQSNNRGVLMVPGSGWHNPGDGYGEPALKAGYEYINDVRDALVQRGFTVFVPNHRAAPRFRYPAAVEDVRRAVRFIRHHGSRFSIAGSRLGALGHSSGGHLVSVLGVEDATRNETEDPVESESSRVQAVVAIAAPHDMSVWPLYGLAYAVGFMGERPPTDNRSGRFLREGIYAEASPVTHVTSDDAAFLLIHGTEDIAVSPEQLGIMDKALRAAGVTVKSVSVEGGSHSPELDHDLIVEWLRTHLLE